MVGQSYKFNIDVTPSTATAPFDYSVKATDIALQTLNDTGLTAVVATYKWVKPGVKVIDVTVENELGTLTGKHTITIAAPVVEKAGTEEPRRECLSCRT